jgi:hypothetical protein
LSVEFRIDLAHVSAKPPLRALADITLQFSDGEVKIRRCAVFEKSGEPPWATLPRIPIEKNGHKVFVPMIELERELQRRILNAVLERYAERPR